MWKRNKDFLGQKLRELLPVDLLCKICLKKKKVRELEKKISQNLRSIQIKQEEIHEGKIKNKKKNFYLS